jgi:predicted metal-dependent enzyme (double-stranded beta helix superfamily)
MEDAVHILEARGETPEAFEAIGARLRELAAQPDLLSEEGYEGLHGSGAGFQIIARDPSGPVLMLARFPAGAPTPVHNHNSWGVACVARGRDRYVRWERMDDGSEPGRADLRLAEQRDLGPGDVVWFGEPPEDIHSQQGVGEAVWELVFFGRDPNAVPRSYFDPKVGVVTSAPATDRRSR